MKIVNESLNEYLYENYKETSWTKTINGKDKTISISDIEKYLKDAKVFEIPVKNIANISILDKTNAKTKERSEKANLEYPIIISKGEDGKYKMILDGHHRLLKAINHNIKTVKAKILDLKSSPKIFKIFF